MKKGIACMMAALFIISPLGVGKSVYATNIGVAEKAEPVFDNKSRGYVYTYQVGDCGYAKYMSIYNDERGGGTRTDDKGHKMQAVAFYSEDNHYVCRFRVKDEAEEDDILAYLSEYKEKLNQLSSQSPQAVEEYLDELLEKDVITFYTCFWVEQEVIDAWVQERNMNVKK